MALGGIACRRQRQYVHFVIYPHRRQVGIDAADQGAVARRRLLAQFGQDGGSFRGQGTAGKADAHVVIDARLARRVDLAVGKFGDEDARFNAGAAAHPRQLAGVQKLVHGVQHVKIDNAQQLDAALARQPGQRCGGITIGVEREKRVTVQVGNFGGRRRLWVAVQQGSQRSGAAAAVEVVERLLQSEIGCLLRDHRCRPSPGEKRKSFKSYSLL